MDRMDNPGGEQSPESSVPFADLGKVANELCDRALQDAKGHLHPLLQQSELEHLDRRHEFLQAFKGAMERQIARTLTTWLPGIQAVFRYDRAPIHHMEDWDGSIHLLIKVPRVSDRRRTLGRRLDQCLVRYFGRLPWGRLRRRGSILEIHQVTPYEIHHGIGYGAMFCSVYTAPVQVWPSDRRSK